MGNTIKTSNINSLELCPKCNKHMERRKRIEITFNDLKKPYIFTEWDWCKNCKHIQHYEKFKLVNIKS